MKPISILAFALVLLLAGGCKKDNISTQNPVPNVIVNRSLNMNNPQYDRLNQQGGFVYLDNEGYKGIVVVHTYTDEFFAMDRACPYHPEADCGVVTVDNSGLSLKCGSLNGAEFIPCCESQYSLDGNVLHGPTVHGLRHYIVSKQGTLITITN